MGKAQAMQGPAAVAALTLWHLEEDQIVLRVILHGRRRCSSSLCGQPLGAPRSCPVLPLSLKDIVLWCDGCSSATGMASSPVFGCSRPSPGFGQSLGCSQLCTRGLGASGGHGRPPAAPHPRLAGNSHGCGISFTKITAFCWEPAAL